MMNTGFFLVEIKQNLMKVRPSFFGHRWKALLFTIGGAILVSRAFTMMVDGYLGIYVPWAAILLALEFLIDATWLASAIAWFFKDNKANEKNTFNLAAASILLHAFRVMIFVLARIGPLTNFDIKETYHATHYARWDWTGIFLAATLSLMGVVGVLVVWGIRRRKGMVQELK
jgi:hypothetical protein